jgi:serine/threonine-protein kinase RsbW
MTPRERQHLIVSASVDQLHRIAQMASHVAAEVGFNHVQVGHIELAVDEACSNIIEHAYGGQPGEIGIEILPERHHQITIVLTDTGKPFDPDNVPGYVPCKSIDELKIGGLGLHLMRKTMDNVCFEFNVPSEQGKFNRLTMVKKL